jgi:hypothetical protein
MRTLEFFQKGTGDRPQIRRSDGWTVLAENYGQISLKAGNWRQPHYHFGKSEIPIFLQK